MYLIYSDPIDVITGVHDVYKFERINEVEHCTVLDDEPFDFSREKLIFIIVAK